MEKDQSDDAIEQLSFEIGIYKKLLNFFQVGDYYYWVFNFKVNNLDLVSADVENMLGYQPAEMTALFLMDKIHPEDRPFFLDFENWVVNFLYGLPVEKVMKYKIRYDFRMKKADGTYMRVLHQVMIIEHDDKGKLVRSLGIHTDISHLKPFGKPVLSVIGLEDEPSYINVDVQKVFTNTKDFLSKREKQVLALLLEGRSSKEIAPVLHISKQTVDNHRKNMLNKHGLSSTIELVTKAIREGWI